MEIALQKLFCILKVVHRSKLVESYTTTTRLLFNLSKQCQCLPSTAILVCVLTSTLNAQWRNLYLQEKLFQTVEILRKPFGGTVLENTKEDTIS